MCASLSSFKNVATDLSNIYHLVSNRRSGSHTRRVDTLRRNFKVVVTERCLRPPNDWTGKSIFACEVFAVGITCAVAVFWLYRTANIPGHWSQIFGNMV